METDGDAPVSMGYEEQDSAMFSSWGIDMIEVDALSTGSTSDNGVDEALVTLLATFLTEPVGLFC